VLHLAKYGTVVLTMRSPFAPLILICRLSTGMQHYNWTHSSSGFPVKHRVKINRHTVDMATRLYWHTINTTTRMFEDETTFVWTGDLPDLWLRDSCAQVHPYLEFSRTNDEMKRMIGGLIIRNAFYISFDPYANAFRPDTAYDHTPETSRLSRYVGTLFTYL
jgi:meiotically up-regulated gene 157 (Mug157) protein